MQVVMAPLHMQTGVHVQYLYFNMYAAPNMLFMLCTVYVLQPAEKWSSPPSCFSGNSATLIPCPLDLL